MTPGLAARFVIFTAFLAGLLALAPPARAEAGYRVCLQPLGRHEAGLLGPVARGIGQAYGFEVSTLPVRALPAAAFYAPRQRYRAARLLDHLRDEGIARAEHCDAVVGFTSVDVSMSKGEHADWGVLGLAYREEGVAVVSSFRMHREADRELLMRRAVKVVLHELGHAVGVAHRNDGPECLMNDARGSVQTVDRARGTLCAGERAAVEAFVDQRLPTRATLDWKAIREK